MKKVLKKPRRKIVVQISPDEHRRVRWAAKASDMSLAAFARNALLYAAESVETS